MGSLLALGCRVNASLASRLCYHPRIYNSASRTISRPIDIPISSPRSHLHRRMRGSERRDVGHDGVDKLHVAMIFVC
jgi:hypothetical protein